MKNTVRIVDKGETFHFKQFAIHQSSQVMKVGTDAVLLGAWAHHPAPTQILDIGTGCGVIGLMLAQRYPHARVTGIDIEQASIELAQKNFSNSPFKDRMTGVLSPLQAFKKEGGPYDLIVSNPPFFTGGAITDQGGRDIMRHTIKLSHNELLRSVRTLLSASGAFAVVLPLLEGLRLIELAGMYNLHADQQVLVRSLADKKVERLLIRFRPEPGKLVEKELVIQNSTASHDYTPEYISLTRAFYLNMPND